MRPLALSAMDSFDVEDLPKVGDLVVIQGMDHIVESARAHHFRNDDDVLVFELIIHAAARLPTTTEGTT